MTTTTCDPFVTSMLAFADRHSLLPPGTRVLAALSGGRDSMALLTALEEAAADRGLTLLAAHYDHGLRGAESARDRAFVADWCRSRGIPLAVGEGDVAARAGETHKGIEETARAMRYAFLSEAAAALDAGAVATAHNAEDNVETVLLHLVRGAGLDGLTGIPPRRGLFVRPLLAAPRQEIEAYLARKGIPWVEDSSNARTVYARNRLRQEVLPVLRALNPALSATLAANLDHLRADRDYLYDRAAPTAALAVAEGDGLSLPARALGDLPDPVAVRVLRLLLARLRRYQIAAVHLDSLLALARQDRPGGRLDLPQGLTARRVYDRLLLSPAPPPPETLLPVAVPGPGTYPMGAGWTVTLTPGTSDGSQGPFRCHLRPPRFPLTLRPRQTGDRLALPGRPAKTLKKWYIDEKIPRALRDSLPVLAGEGGVLAAAGLGPRSDLAAPAGAEALTVDFRQEPSLFHSK